MNLNIYKFQTFLYIVFTFYFVKISYAQSGWIQQNSGITSKINVVYFENSQTGWCVGDSGKIIKTTDGGTNWYLINSGTFKNLKSLSFNSSNYAFIVGDSGLVLRTTDGGNLWNYYNISSNNFNFTSVFFVNNDIGFIGGIPYTGEMNKIFKTSDGGYIWDSLKTNPSEFVSVKTIYFANANVGWFIQGYGILGEQVLFNTTDGGINWNIQFTNNILYSVYFINPLTGWNSGDGSGFNVNKSTNGGSNWNPCLFCGLSPIHSFFFTNSVKGWGASEGGIYYTTNAGTNWTTQNTNHPLVTYNSIYFTDSLTGWVVGDSGTILKTTTGGVLTSFTNQSTEIPDKYFLSQNYPNPFNPNTIISFSILENVKSEMSTSHGGSNVKLINYSSLGNEVATLVNERKNAGSYEVEFNGSNFSSGIYFYSLTVDGNLIDTKKMILLK